MLVLENFKIFLKNYTTKKIKKINQKNIFTIFFKKKALRIINTLLFVFILTLFLIQGHHTLVREFWMHRLIIIYRLLSQIICQSAPFYCLLSDISNIELQQQNLPLSYSPSKSGLFEDVFDWIHFGHQPSSVTQHILPQMVYFPC